MDLTNSQWDVFVAAEGYNLLLTGSLRRIIQYLVRQYILAMILVSISSNKFSTFSLASFEKSAIK